VTDYFFTYCGRGPIIAVNLTHAEQTTMDLMNIAERTGTATNCALKTTSNKRGITSGSIERGRSNLNLLGRWARSGIFLPQGAHSTHQHQKLIDALCTALETRAWFTQSYTT
jgi:hypothetical protein